MSGKCGGDGFYCSGCENCRPHVVKVGHLCLQGQHTPGCGHAPGAPLDASIQMKVIPPPPKTVKDHLKTSLHEVEQMMLERHDKYGPGNIAKHGPVGILVRMDDKFARLEAGQGNFDDETVENTLDDIIGYALIWKLWLRKQWPGSELAPG